MKLGIEDLASVKPGNLESSKNLQKVFGSERGVGVEDKASHQKPTFHDSTCTKVSGGFEEEALVMPPTKINISYHTVGQQSSSRTPRFTNFKFATKMQRMSTLIFCSISFHILLIPTLYSSYHYKFKNIAMIQLKSDNYFHNFIISN